MKKKLLLKKGDGGSSGPGRSFFLLRREAQSLISTDEPPFSLPLNQVIKTCPSTNDLAKALARQGAPHGSWISACTQTQGRGRLGRKWASPEGQLFLSVILRQVPLSWLPWIPLFAAFAVLKALPTRSLTPLWIKWPNDLVTEWMENSSQGPHPGSFLKKWGGILCETSASLTPGPRSQEQATVIVGIGVNRTAPDPRSLTLDVGQSIGLDACLPPLSLPPLDTLRTQVHRSLLETWITIHRQGLEWLQKRLQAVLLFKPQSRWQLPNGKQYTFLGLSPAAQLLVEGPEQSPQVLSQEDASQLSQARRVPSETS